MGGSDGVVYSETRDLQGDDGIHGEARVEEDTEPQERLNDVDEKKGPLIVRFPRQTTSPVEPVKLEAEEAVESKPARNMVQVTYCSLPLLSHFVSVFPMRARFSNSCL